MRHYLYILAVLALSACSPPGTRLAELKTAAPTYADFKGSLASEYLGYAEALGEQGHPIRSDRVANKGLESLKNAPPLPEEPGAGHKELQKARDDLMLVLTDDMKVVAPQKAARTQLYYDCWALQAQSVMSPDEQLCEDAFRESLSELQAIAELLVHGEEGKHVIHFTEGSAKLSEEAGIVLDAIAKKISHLGNYDIKLMAYAHHGRSSAAVRALAKHRILTIEKALIAHGVDAGKIHEERMQGNKEVFLSVDQAGGGANSVALSILTFVQTDGENAK